jgi:hypothetical protein
MNEKELKTPKNEKAIYLFVCELQPLISDLHMATKGREVPYWWNKQERNNVKRTKTSMWEELDGLIGI